MLTNFPLSTGLGTVNQPPPLAGSAFLNNVALLYSAQGLNSDREEVNLICNLNISSTSSLMSEWERKQRREGQEQGLQQTDTGSVPISLSSLAFLTSQIMCIQHSFLASCLLAMCWFFFSVPTVGPNQKQRKPFQSLFALKSINQILKFGWLSPSPIPDKFSTSNFVYCSDFYGKYLYQSNISSWV